MTASRIKLFDCPRPAFAILVASRRASTPPPIYANEQAQPEHSADIPTPDRILHTAMICGLYTRGSAAADTPDRFVGDGKKAVLDLISALKEV